MRSSAWLLCLCLTGCVATTAEQSADRVATTQPPGTIEATIQQAGAGSLAAPLSASIVSVVPWGLVVILGIVVIGLLWLMDRIVKRSHDREMARLRCENRGSDTRHS